MGLFCQYLWQHSGNLVIRPAQLFLSTAFCVVSDHRNPVSRFYSLVKSRQENKFHPAGNICDSLLVCQPVSGVWGVIWSPYQKLVVRESQADEIGIYQIEVNNASYQEMMDLSDAYISADPEKFPPELKGLSQYDIPSLFHPDPESILIVGAGTGNDVAGALRHNIPSITAVDIDPAIISIGQELHPEKPYSSPQVRVVNDDARSFFATTTDKYDIISFGLLDSHTTTAMTNARLDHYVYTKESILQAKSKLEEGGVMVLNFYAQRLFIIDRIERMLDEVFNQPPLVFVIDPNPYGRGGVMFVTGDWENIQNQLSQNDRLAAYISQRHEAYPLQLPHTTRVITDDWPYLYLEFTKNTNTLLSADWADDRNFHQKLSEMAGRQ